MLNKFLLVPSQCGLLREKQEFKKHFDLVLLIMNHRMSDQNHTKQWCPEAIRMQTVSLRIQDWLEVNTCYIIIIIMQLTQSPTCICPQCMVLLPKRNVDNLFLCGERSVRLPTRQGGNPCDSTQLQYQRSWYNIVVATTMFVVLNTLGWARRSQQVV